MTEYYATQQLSKSKNLKKRNDDRKCPYYLEVLSYLRQIIQMGNLLFEDLGYSVYFDFE